MQRGAAEAIWQVRSDHPRGRRPGWWTFAVPGGRDSEPEVFDFLGFTHYWGKSGKGNWVVKRKTAKKKLKQAVRRVYEWCKREPPRPCKGAVAGRLCRKLHGHYGYYGITFNMRSLNRFYEQVKRSWRKWLNRRSRDKDMPWERFNRLLETLSTAETTDCTQIRVANP